MSSSYRPTKELIFLAVQFIDDELSEADEATLRNLVEENRSNGRWFVEWMELNAVLQLELGDEACLPLAARPLLASEPQNSRLSVCPPPLSNYGGSIHCGHESRFTTFLRSKAWLTVAVSVICVFAYVLGLATAWVGSRATDAMSAVAAPVTVSDGKGIATVAAGVDADFSEGISLGSRIGPGRLCLNRGVAQIVFDTGAVLILQGPSELELVDNETCFLISGSLSADVLPDGSGFKIGAGGIQIAERDARFGLRTAPDDGTEVHVFDGELKLVNYGGLVRQLGRLEGGEAIRLHEHDSTTTWMPTDSNSFVTGREFARLRRINEQRAYARWLEYSKRWLTDPAVVLRYEFGPSGDRNIINTVDAGSHLATSRQSSPRWIAGRWSDKQTMLFDGHTDVLDVPDHPDLQLQREMTVAVWLRVRSLPKSGWTRLIGKGNGADRNYGLWMRPEGALLWQVCPDTAPETQTDWDRAGLETDIVPTGEWQFVVGVVDNAKFKVYLNGELQGSRAAPINIVTSDDSLTIGYYSEVPCHNDYFCGEIDELILLNRPLSHNEIFEMYEAGRPEYVPAVRGFGDQEEGEEILSPATI